MKIAPHVFNDVDIWDKRSLGYVLRREIGLLARDMLRATRAASGVRSRLGAPYWFVRRFIGMVTRPMDSSDLIRLDFRLFNDSVASVVLRKSQSDLYILREIFLEGMYDLDIPVDRLGTVIDCGANAGLSAAFFQARYAPSQLIAVEPIPESVRVLEANNLASGGTWSIEPRAVASKAAELTFFVSGMWSACTAIEHIGRYRHTPGNRMESVLERPKLTVSSVSIGDLITEYDLSRIDLLKLDIEGYEEDVVCTNNDWLGLVQRLIIEVHEKYINGERVRAALRCAGLRPVPQHGPCELWIRVGVDGN